MSEDSKDLFRTLIVGFIVIITLAIVVFGGIIISSKVELENDKERMELEYQYELKYKALQNNFERIEVYGPTLG